MGFARDQCRRAGQGERPCRRRSVIALRGVLRVQGVGGSGSTARTLAASTTAFLEAAICAEHTPRGVRPSGCTLAAELDVLLDEFVSFLCTE